MSRTSRPGVRVADRPSLRQRRPRRERGGIVVFFGLVLSVLLGFTGLAIDVARVHDLQTDLQIAADSAALAGARELPDGIDAATVVKEYVQKNIGLPASAWVGCVDPDALNLLPNANHSCISMSEGGNHLRVRIPTRNLDTLFLRAIGTGQTKVGATATAEALVTTQDRVIPAAVSSSQGAGNLCIETSGSNTACFISRRGNFGTLTAPRLRIHRVSQAGDALMVNLALGLDHTPQTWVGGQRRICVGAVTRPCPRGSTNDTGNPADFNTGNHLNTNTGNAINEVTDGLVSGRTLTPTDTPQSFFCGRLSRPDITSENALQPQPNGSCTPLGPTGGPTSTTLGVTINARHLYHWLTPAAKLFFYPELALLTPPAVPSVAEGAAVPVTVYTPGDRRLDCFLAGRGAVTASTGYSYNYATSVQTYANCSTVGGNILLGFANTGLPRCLDGRVCIIDQGVVVDPRFGNMPILYCWPGEATAVEGEITCPNGGGAYAPPIKTFLSLFFYRTYVTSTKVPAVDAWLFQASIVNTPTPSGALLGSSSQAHVRLID